MKQIKKFFFTIVFIVIATNVLTSCSNSDDHSYMRKKYDINSFPVVESVDAIQLDVTETEAIYQDFWLVNNNKGNGNNRTGAEIIDQLDFLFDFVIQNNGELNICIEFDFKHEKLVSADTIESIRESIENGVNIWKEGLHGYNGWYFNENIPVGIAAISKSDKTLLNSHLDKITGQESCLSNEGDFKVKFSDYDIGSRGFGGNWGMQLRWYVFRSELASGVFHITYHELGHVIGLPDLYTYPSELEGHALTDVKSIMANNNYKEVQHLDYSMVRAVWERRVN